MYTRKKREKKGTNIRKKSINIRKKNTNRVDSVKTIIKLINNPNVKYYNKTDFYHDGQVTWVIYDHVETRAHNTDPWLNRTKDKNQIYIGLFHDPIFNSSDDAGKVFNDTKYHKDISHFKNNDYLFIKDNFLEKTNQQLFVVQQYSKLMVKKLKIMDFYFGK